MLDQIRLKPTFFRWFLLMIFLAVTSFYGLIDGFFKSLYVLEVSHISFLIIFLTLGTLLHVGWVCWNLKTTSLTFSQSRLMWLNEMISISPLLGIMGTVVGFVLQANTLVSGSAGLAPLTTSFFATMFGVGAAIVLRVTRAIARDGMHQLQRQKEASDLVASRRSIGETA